MAEPPDGSRRSVRASTARSTAISSAASAATPVKRQAEESTSGRKKAPKFDDGYDPEAEDSDAQEEHESEEPEEAPKLSRRARSGISSAAVSKLTRTGVAAQKMQQLGGISHSSARTIYGPNPTTIAGGMSHLAEIDRSNHPGINRLDQDRFPGEVEADTELSNLSSLRKAWENITILREVSSPEQAGPLAIDALLALPEISGANWVPKKLRAHTDANPRHVRSQGSKWALQVFNGTKETSFNIGKTECTQQEIDSCVRTIVAMMRRVPNQAVFDQTGRTSDKPLILRTALVYNAPRSEFNMPSIRFNVVDNVENYSTNISFWTSSGQKMEAQIYVNPAKVNPNISVPTISQTLSWTGQRIEGRENFVPPASDRLFNEPVYRKSLEILKYITYKCHNRVFASDSATKSYIQELLNTFMPDVIKRGRGSRGAFGGYAIYRTMHVMSQTGPKTLVIFSRAVEKTISGPEIEYHGVEYHNIKVTLPVIEVNSHAFSRVGPVLEAITNSFWADLGLEQMIDTGCRVADTINAIIDNEEHSEIGCTCDEHMRKFTKHACNRCGFMANCDTLIFSDIAHSRLCEKCIEIVGSHKSEYSQRPIYDQLIMTIRAELKEIGLPSETSECRRIVDRIQDAMPRHGDLSDPDNAIVPEYISGLPGQTLRVPDEMTQRERDELRPSKLSADAVQQTWPLDDQTMAYHAPGNIAICPLWAQLFKAQSTPGQTVIMRELSRTDLDANEKARLLKTEDDMFTIQLKTKYRRVHRFGKYNKKDFQALKYERTSGKLLPVSDVTAKRWLDKKLIVFDGSRPVPPPAPSKNWKPGSPGEYEGRIKPLVDEIVADYRRTTPLEVSSDGCPWPSSDPMPWWWSWWAAWYFFGERFWRLWILCNGRWWVVDNVETLFLEVLVQFCRGGRGFLGLEWVLNVRHPRRLALGQIHHARRMRTAWTKEKPRTLADRDESELNLSCETMSENYGKANFAESTYDDEDALIPTQWRAWYMPRAYYDPGLEPDFLADDEEDSAFGDVDQHLDIEELKGKMKMEESQEEDVEVDDDEVNVGEVDDDDAEE